jgi:hypothetical protein
VDPLGATPVDAYETSGQLREAQTLLTPFEIFPWGTQPARETDSDHTVPYRDPDEGGPPGQTALGNLGPLGRRHHIAKTFSGFTVHQPLPGLYYWRTPTGWWYQVDHRGSRPLGREAPAAVRPVLSVAAARHMSPTEDAFRRAVLGHLVA